MKAKKGEEHEHVVYMSRQVAAMFRELKALAGESRFVLPGRGKQNQPFAANALNKALEGLTFAMEPFTIHDQRRTASTLLNENGWSKDVVEKALSHEKGGMAGIYNRAEYAKQRAKMLQWWADYVDSIITESNFAPGCSFGDCTGKGLARCCSAARIGMIANPRHPGPCGLSINDRCA